MRRRFRPERLAATLLVVGAWLHASAGSADDERVAAGGLVDVEGWTTDAHSEFPGRNEGDPASDARLRAWLAVRLGAGFDAFAEGRLEGGKGSDDVTSGPELEQGYVRYSYTGSTRLVVEAGRIVHPIGNFPRRYFSNVNPLIGQPYGYSELNPLGVRISGWTGMCDYTVAGVDRPFTYGADVPEPGRALRPELAFGVTPMIGLRLGVYGTRGPYLEGDSHDDQTVAGFDFHFSRGYFVLNGDFSWSRYGIPGGGDPIDGRWLWIEPVYTLSPRVFTSLRIESGIAPYVEFEDGAWEAERPQLFDVEAAVGTRILPQLTVKVSYRYAHWTVDDDLRPEFPDGHALAAQVSYAFDIDAWFRHDAAQKRKH